MFLCATCFKTEISFWILFSPCNERVVSEECTSPPPPPPPSPPSFPLPSLFSSFSSSSSSTSSSTSPSSDTYLQAVHLVLLHDLHGVLLVALRLRRQLDVRELPFSEHLVDHVVAHARVGLVDARVRSLDVLEHFHLFGNVLPQCDSSLCLEIVLLKEKERERGGLGVRVGSNAKKGRREEGGRQTRKR